MHSGRFNRYSFVALLRRRAGGYRSVTGAVLRRRWSGSKDGAGATASACPSTGPSATRNTAGAAKRILRHYYSGAKVVKKGRSARRCEWACCRGAHRSPSAAGRRPTVADSWCSRSKGSSDKIVGARTGQTLRLKASSTGGARIFKNGNGKSARGAQRVRRAASDRSSLVTQRFGTQVATEGKSYAVGSRTDRVRLVLVERLLSGEMPERGRRSRHAEVSVRPR